MTPAAIDALIERAKQTTGTVPRPRLVRELIAALESQRDLLREIVEATALASQYVGCGDNSCLFVKPSGMATNGSCRCVERGNGRPGVASSLGRLYKACEKARVAAGVEKMSPAKQNEQPK